VAEHQKESPYGDPYALALHQHATEHCQKIAEQPRDAASLLSPADLEDLNFHLMLQKAFKILHEIQCRRANFSSFTIVKALELGRE